MTIVNDYFVNGEILDYTWGLGDKSIFTFVLLILLFIFFLCLINFMLKDFEVTIFEIIMTLILVIGLILNVLLFISGFKNKPIYDQIHRYEAIIEPGTDFYSIVDNYDIVERKGDLFVLEELPK